ncbi:MAG: tRNA (adenosine(37)-N6)-threonylcarbamoyltransferase complex ATPase subunit type 1 TsaE [Gemmatimonadaceae bacterium]
MTITTLPTPPKAHVTLHELNALGEALGRCAVAPHVIALSGDLGAGKTTLIQAICRGYGVTDEVTSPTFALVHRYSAPRSPVYHLDLYRLKDASELTNLAWDDILDERAVVLVEWPDRAGDQLPADATQIFLSHVAADGSVRDIRLGAG